MCGPEIVRAARGDQPREPPSNGSAGSQDAPECRHECVLAKQQKVRDMAIPVETLPSDPKPASKSATMIAAWVVIGASILGSLGVVLTPADVEKWTKVLVDLAPLLVTLGGGIVAAWGRYRAASPIAGGPADPKVLAQEEIRARLRS